MMYRTFYIKEKIKSDIDKFAAANKIVKYKKQRTSVRCFFVKLFGGLPHIEVKLFYFTQQT